MYNLESKVQKSFANNEKNFIVDNNCVVVCPWVIRSGFQNISENGFLHSAADPYWFGFFQKIFTGDQVIIATWEDSTYLTKIDNKYEFKYNFQTGKYYQGAVIVGSAESGTEIEPVEGNQDFLAMKNNSSVSIRFENWVPSEEDLYKLYTIPDLYGNKWYYISNVKYLNDLQSTLGNDEDTTYTLNETSIPVVEVTFTSLVDKLQVSGKAVEQYVQYAGIGEPYVVPLVTQYNANDLEEETNEWIEPTKLVSYIPYEPNSANYLQVELQGANGFSAIEVEGRCLKYEDDAWVSTPWKRLLLKNSVANQVNELNRTSLPSRNFFYFPQEELSFVTSKTFQEDNKTRQDALAMNQSAGKISMGNKDTWTDKGTGQHKSNPVTTDGTHWDYNNSNWKPLSNLGISSISCDTKGNFYAEDTIELTSSDTFVDILNKNSFIYETQPLIPLGFKSSKPYHISAIPIIGKIVSKFWGDKTINPHTTQRKPISIGYFMDCDIAGMLANIYSAEENNTVYAPLSALVGDENRASKYLGTTALNTTLCFSLTDKLQEGSNNYNTIYFGQTKNEYGQSILSNDAVYLYGRPNQVLLDKDADSVFVIDSITIYGLHKGKVKLTAFSDLSSSIWTTTIQSKANWTNSIRDWATTIQTGGWAEQYCDWSILDFSWPDRPDKLSTNDIAIDFKNDWIVGEPSTASTPSVLIWENGVWKSKFNGISSYAGGKGVQYNTSSQTSTVTKTYSDLGLESKAEFKKKYKQMLVPISGKVVVDDVGSLSIPARANIAIDIGDADTYSIDRIAMQFGSQVDGVTIPVIAKNDAQDIQDKMKSTILREKAWTHLKTYTGGLSIKFNATITLSDTGISINITESDYMNAWGNDSVDKRNTYDYCKWALETGKGTIRTCVGGSRSAKATFSIPKLTLVPRPVTTQLKIEGGSTQIEMQSGYSGQDSNVWTIYTRESETAEWTKSTGVFTLSGEPEGVTISQETTEGATTGRVVWDDQQNAGTYTIKVQAAKEVGEKVLEVEQEVKLYCEEPAPYTITTSVTNGSYTGPTEIAKIGGTATITIKPNTDYKLPSSVNVTGATYTYDSTTGVINLSNPTSNVTISASCTIYRYSITTNVTNGTYSGDTKIVVGGTASVTIKASSGYTLPTSISVSGATYTYNSSTGVISLSNPTGNVTITATCLYSWDGLALTSSGTSTIQLTTSGTLSSSVNIYYRKATDSDWTQWLSGTSGSSSTITLSNGEKLYVWNKNSTLSNSESSYIKFAMSGTISASGNCNSMINFGSLSKYCYYSLFRDCTSLTVASITLPTLTLIDYCYAYMFYSCTSLTVPPQLPATSKETTTTAGCCNSMFQNCSSLKVNNSGTGTLFFTCPFDAFAVVKVCVHMFDGTGGSQTSDPLKNGKYYYN